MSKASEQIARIQKGLGVSEQEAKEIYEADCAIDRDENMEFDLPQEKLKVARKFAHTGTRKMKEAGLNLPKKERTRNATQDQMIDEIMTFLQNSASFEVKDMAKAAKGYKIDYASGDLTFTLTITKHNKKK